MEHVNINPAHINLYTPLTDINLRTVYVNDEPGKYAVCYRHLETQVRTNGPYRFTLAECNVLVSTLNIQRNVLLGLNSANNVMPEGYYWSELHPGTPVPNPVFQIVNKIETF